MPDFSARDGTRLAYHVRGGGPPLLCLPGGPMRDSVYLAAELAALFPAARLVVQPGAGHYPWLDDPAWFSAAVTDFFAGA